MKFTDDDLKRFKERNAKPRYAMQLRQEQWEALLARLEASEKFGRSFNSDSDKLSESQKRYLEAWRESKGE